MLGEVGFKFPQVLDFATKQLRNLSSLVTALRAASVAVINAAQTFVGAQRASITVISSSANSTAINFALNNDFSTTLSENTTFANPTNVVAGQSGSIFITQGAGSAFTVAYGSNWKFSNGSVPSVSTTLSAQDTLYYNVRDSTHIEANLVKANA